MEALQKRRLLLRTDLEKINELYSECRAGELTVMQVNELLDQLKALEGRAEKLREDSMKKASDEEVTEIVSAHKLIDKEIFGLSVKLKTDKFEMNISKENEIKSSENSTRLPKLTLPVFSHLFEDWICFRDSFQAAVINNPNLSGIQRLQYLKSCLKGEAAELIRNVAMSNESFENAWELLKERYDSTRRLVEAQVARILKWTSHHNIGKPANLQVVLDNVNDAIRALRLLKRSDAEITSDIISHLLVSNLDPETRKEFETKQHPTKALDLDEVLKDLQRLATAHAQTGKQTRSDTHRSSQSNSLDSRKRTVLQVNTDKCGFCDRLHLTHNCYQYKNASRNEKVNLIKQHKLCFRCLGSKHFARDCSMNCAKCGQKHHKSIHFDNGNQNSTGGKLNTDSINGQQKVSDQQTGVSQVQNTMNSHVGNANIRSKGFVLLRTARIQVYDNRGVPHTLRALIDNGSQLCAITERAAQFLRLPKYKTDLKVTGLAEAKVGTVKTMVELGITAELDKLVQFRVEAIVLKRISGNQPMIELNRSRGLDHIQGLPLADPEWYLPAEVDVLLGEEIWHDVIHEKRVMSQDSKIVAQSSVFGYILSGRSNLDTLKKVTVFHVASTDELLQRFWEMEKLPDVVHLSPEEKAAEKHFVENFKRLETGRYQVRLPIKVDGLKLGDSKQLAYRRLLAVERRLARQPELRQDYVKFLQDYIANGEMSLVKDKCEGETETYYMPHHAVTRESTTTKVRVVLDASAKTSNGLSLNDRLMCGKIPQPELLDILLRFRSYPIGFVADLKRMFQAVYIDPEDRKFQRILWREEVTQPVCTYEINCVTFGAASSPFLATRTVKQLTLDDGEDVPEAREMMASNLYVDDLLGGGTDVLNTAILVRDLDDLAKRGCFEFRKWSSNDPSVLKNIPENNRELKSSLMLRGEPTTGALGLYWLTEPDELALKVAKFPEQREYDRITKREFLSEAAKLWDPLGLVSPVTLWIKHQFQRLWKEYPCDWSDPVPEELSVEWKKFRADIPRLGEIKLPRFVGQVGDPELNLFGFCDASQIGYGIVIYSSYGKGNKEITLVISKTRVAPINIQSIPRLELMGALLLAEVMKRVSDIFKVPKERVKLFTDSEVVLAWLAKSSHHWKTFVANRVAKIHDLSDYSQWYLVSGDLNPADLPSRGSTVQQLLDATDWYKPSVLSEGKLVLRKPERLSGVNIPEAKRSKTTEENVCMMGHVLENSGYLELIKKYSDFNKLISVTCYVHRFISNTVKIGPKFSGRLSAIEKQIALWSLVRTVQQEVFKSELNDCHAGRNLKKNSPLKELNVFLDRFGLIRVGGRIRRTTDRSFDAKHQLLLPRNHPLTDLIIRNAHLSLLHASTTLTLNTLRLQFWILRGKDAVKRIIHQCTVCCRYKAKLYSQFMSDLPTERITVARPFEDVGTDFSGPVVIKPIFGQRNRLSKSYIVIFCCYRTRAIHLELSSGLDAQSFIQALKRFVSRRGVPRCIHSDRGTGLIAADKELKADLKTAWSEQELGKIFVKMEQEGIEWKLLPPYSPHHSCHETLLKPVKHHLRRVLGDAHLTYEGLSTLLCQIEACVNSRPLTPISNDPNDLEALTPAHFLVGTNLKSLLEPNYLNIPTNRLKEYQRSQKLLQDFWRNWNTDYISTLTSRRIWKERRENIKEGQMVLISEPNIPPARWRIGRIIATHPGADGIVRVVTVRTVAGDFQRPIIRLAPLWNEDS